MTTRKPVTKAHLQRRIKELSADNDALRKQLSEVAKLRTTLSHYEAIVHGERYVENQRTAEMVGGAYKQVVRRFLAMSRDMAVLRNEIARKADK